MKSTSTVIRNWMTRLRSSNHPGEIAQSRKPRTPRTPPERPFNYEQCRDALGGVIIPEDLTSITARCAVIRGVRTHYEYVTSDTVSELCFVFPDIARARNARLIMSGCIPVKERLVDPNHVPYCIWHPDVASEDTYRQLAQRYPVLRYQIGRACAVADYHDLYQELGLLPDVSIAEEARESDSKGSTEIYRTIMQAPVRYKVMDDLHRSINLGAKAPAFLNGDTRVCWMLDQRYTLPRRRYEGIFPLYPDIEEDRGLGEEEIELPIHRMDYTYDEASLLFTPLPLNLPTVKKDLLIQMAAYEGNIDRYARLMRPGYMTEAEAFSVVRGIFHHTMFARWWADQLQTNSYRIRTRDSDEAFGHISEAVNARRIMTNEISGLTGGTEYLPYMIWWPLKPLELTLVMLAQQCPKMTHQIAIACIFCDYEHLYRQLQPSLHRHLWLAAEQSPNPLYKEDLKKRAAEEGIDLMHVTYHWTGASSDWLAPDLEPTSNVICSPLNPFVMADDGQRIGSYFEYHIKSGIVEKYVWQQPDLLREWAHPEE